METKKIMNTKNDLQAQMINQTKWQRITLLSILGYEAAGAMSGGILLIASPDGRLMDMSVDIMHGVLSNCLIPGIILLGLGLLNTAAFAGVLLRSRIDWILAGLALGGLAVWFVTEIIILQELHWLHYMWGSPVIAGILMIIPLIPLSHWKMRKALLVCGILSSLFYFALNIFIPMQWEGYDSTSQVVSELSAVGAPTRLSWTLLCVLYTLLVTAFGWGVWESAGRNRYLRIAGWLLVLYGALGILWPVAPMHLRETLAAGGATLSDTMHITLGAVTEIIYLLALGFAAAALGKPFRIYSVVTFIILMVFGVLTFLGAPGVSANQPTPLLGIWERINIGIFLLWVVVLAIILLRADKGQDPIDVTIPEKKGIE